VNANVKEAKCLRPILTARGYLPFKNWNWAEIAQTDRQRNGLRRPVSATTPTPAWCRMQPCTRIRRHRRRLVCPARGRYGPLIW
jgi:hypothetical protein